MLRSVESHTIAENQPNIRNKLVSTDITRVGWIRVWFNGVRSQQFAFDSGKVHGMLDDLKIMRYLQSLRVDGEAEWSGVLHLFESSYRRQCKFVLR